MEEFYIQLQELRDKVDKKDILIIHGDWNAKVGTDALADWKNYWGPFCNAASNEQGLRLLEFTSYNNMVLPNTLGEHKASRRWTWHAPDGTHHQIDYIHGTEPFQIWDPHNQDDLPCRKWSWPGDTEFQSQAEEDQETQEQ